MKLHKWKLPVAFASIEHPALGLMAAADIVVAANIPIIIVDTRNVPQGVMPDTAHVQDQSIMVSCQGCRLYEKSHIVI